MKTLKLFSNPPESIPALSALYLADLGEAFGKQELFIKQSPQKLKVLREHALIESAISSNRIEGVEIYKSRVATVILGKPLLKDRSEEEVSGYRDALNLIHTKKKLISLSEETIKKFHNLIKSNMWDSGKYKEKPGDIIQTYPDGNVRIRFKTVSPDNVDHYIKMSIKLYNQCLRKRYIHQLIAIAAFNLDFLCVHPFRDGNGRVSRLLFLLQCYQAGYKVGRYISLERLIEENKERYYETLEMSSKGWHEGKHNPWHYINFLMYILKSAYKEFEERVGKLKSPRGSKTELVKTTIDKLPETFSLTDLEIACPGVSRDMIRKVLSDLKKSDLIESISRGPGALWRKKVISLKECNKEGNN